MRRAWLIAAVAAMAVSCELSEITIAEADDVVVAEIVLWAGSPIQTAYLHRTSSARGSARVFNASITVSSAGTEDELRFHADADSLCLSQAPAIPDASTGTCYVATGGALSVEPGRTYTVRVELNDGRSMTGTSTVPGSFEIQAPTAPVCRLPPASTMDLVWSPAAGAAAYLAQARMHGLREALRSAGVDVRGSGPVLINGLSITEADTTLSFPGDLGLFGRFDDAFHAVLVAIRGGLPAGVRTELAIAAVDPNYVNWVRGGSFNPSGAVRISSLTGDGIGVFGAVVVHRRELHTSGQAELPGCE